MDAFIPDDENQDALREYLSQNSGAAAGNPQPYATDASPQMESSPADGPPAPPPIGSPAYVDDRAAKIKDYLTNAYAKASDTSGVKTAQDQSQRANLIANLGQAFETLAKSTSMANGGAGVNTGFYSGIKQQAQQGIDQAENARQKEIAKFNQQYALQHQVASDVLNQAVAENNVEKQKQASAILAAQNDPMSPVSKNAQATFKKIYAGIPALASVDVSNMSAAELAGLGKNADSLARIQGQKEERMLALEDRRQLMKDKEEAKGIKLTPAQKAVDETFGKEYADYKAGGDYASINKNLNTLDAAIAKLESQPDLTGGLSGRLPDQVRSLTNPEAVALKQDVQGVVQNTLRQILGPQFTEREGQAIMARAFDPSLPSSENIKRVKAIRDELVQRAKEKESAAKFYQESGGTLKDYKPGGANFDSVAAAGTPQATPAAQASPAPHGNQVRQNGIIYEWNGQQYVPETQMAGGQ